MRFYLTLISFLPLIVFGQEKEYEWSVALSNGYSYTEINSRSNLAGATNNRFYADQKEYYFLKPSIRLNTEKHFWGLTINDIKFGERFSSGLNDSIYDGFYIDYARIGFDLSINHRLIHWKNFDFTIGESIGFGFKKDDGLRVYNLLLDRSETSLFLNVIPRVSYKVSEKFSLEIASLIQVVEAKRIDEDWSEYFITILPTRNRYSSINALNAIDVQLSLEYRF